MGQRKAEYHSGLTSPSEHNWALDKPLTNLTNSQYLKSQPKILYRKILNFLKTFEISKFKMALELKTLDPTGLYWAGWDFIRNPSLPISIWTSLSLKAINPKEESNLLVFFP